MALVLITGYLFAHFGKDRGYYFTPDEVAAARLVYENAPPGSLLIEGNRNYPGLFVNYDRFTYVPIDREPAGDGDRDDRRPGGAHRRVAQRPRLLGRLRDLYPVDEGGDAGARASSIPTCWTGSRRRCWRHRSSPCSTTRPTPRSSVLVKPERAPTQRRARNETADRRWGGAVGHGLVRAGADRSGGSGGGPRSTGSAAHRRGVGVLSGRTGSGPRRPVADGGHHRAGRGRHLDQRHRGGAGGPCHGRGPLVAPQGGLGLWPG